jgi:hypothetical protein
LPKPPGKNWAKAFQDRHQEVRARAVKALDWNRHKKNIYNKVTQWFEVVEGVLRDPAVLAENVYNMDETGLMLSMLGSVKVLLGKNDMRTYRGARIKREVVTAVECVSEVVLIQQARSISLICIVLRGAKPSHYGTLRLAFCMRVVSIQPRSSA